MINGQHYTKRIAERIKLVLNIIYYWIYLNITIRSCVPAPSNLRDVVVKIWFFPRDPETMYFHRFVPSDTFNIRRSVTLLWLKDAFRAEGFTRGPLFITSQKLHSIVWPESYVLGIGCQEVFTRRSPHGMIFPHQKNEKNAQVYLSTKEGLEGRSRWFEHETLTRYVSRAFT